MVANSSRVIYGIPACGVAAAFAAKVARMPAVIIVVVFAIRVRLDKLICLHSSQWNSIYLHDRLSHPHIGLLN